MYAISKRIMNVSVGLKKLEVFWIRVVAFDPIFSVSDFTEGR